MIARSTTTLLKISAAVAATATLIALGTGRAPAGEMSYKPLQAIDETFGSKHVVAVYQKEEGVCHVQLMVEQAQNAGPDITSAARVRFDLLPYETAVVDSAESHSLAIACGEDAASLTVRQSNPLLAQASE